MERAQRDFKGVWIPKEIWLSSALSVTEKALFAEICSLDNERGCWASNKYFADFFKISPRQIATYIASLRDKGYVTVTIRNLNERTIRAAGRFTRVSDAQVNALHQSARSLGDKWSNWSRRGMKKTS